MVCGGLSYSHTGDVTNLCFLLFPVPGNQYFAHTVFIASHYKPLSDTQAVARFINCVALKLHFTIML